MCNVLLKEYRMETLYKMEVWFFSREGKLLKKVKFLEKDRSVQEIKEKGVRQAKIEGFIFDEKEHEIYTMALIPKKKEF